MINNLKPLLIIAISYFIGSFPSGYVFYYMKTGKDIRKIGKRQNSGTTNVLLNGGVFLGSLTLVADILKGFIPVLIVMHFYSQGLVSQSAMAVFAGLFAVLGHIYPIYIGFHGGKGLAASIGVFLGLMPEIMVSYFIVFLILLPITKRPSLLGFALSLILPFYAQIEGCPHMYVFVSVLLSIMYVFVSMNHLKEIFAGAEYKEFLTMFTNFQK